MKRAIIGLVGLFALVLFQQDVSAKEDVWLEFNFDYTVKPSGGTFRNEVQANFSRPSQAISPSGVEFGKGVPRFAAGLSGTGIFMGPQVHNQLPAALADISFEKGELEGITAVKGASLEQITTEEAWHGDTCLEVKPRTTVGSGFTVSRELKAGLSIFSIHIKGKGMLSLRATAPPGALLGEAKRIVCKDEWKRYDVWVWAPSSTSADFSVVTKMGMPTTFYVDGLQVDEGAKNLQANFEKRSFPYGKNFSPGCWVQGGSRSAADALTIKWEESGGEEFPVEEGSYNVWYKPAIHRADCAAHSIIKARYLTYSLKLAGYNTIDFYRGRNEAANKKENKRSHIRIGRPASLKKDTWCMLTVTWSNEDKKVVLYCNGRKLKEIESKQTGRLYGSQLYIGHHHSRQHPQSAQGVLDDLRIYSRALSPKEIEEAYDKGKKALSKKD